MSMPAIYEKLQNPSLIPVNQLASCEDLLGIMSDSYCARLYQSMKSFDPPLPLLIDGFSNIVTGHARFQILRLAGHFEVAVVDRSLFTQAETEAIKEVEGLLISNPVWTAEFIDKALLSLGNPLLSEVN